MKNPKLKVKTVFIDIDSTLTDGKPGVVATEQNILFVELISKNNNISMEEAAQRLNSAESRIENMVGEYWPFGMLETLNTTEKDLWQVLAEDARKRLFMYPDAREFIVNLKSRIPGVKVYTATTNPKLIILAKLSVGDLADHTGSPYLDEAFGGEEVYPGGKLHPGFYSAILERTDADPETTLMVGDHPEFDLALAKAAGINQVVLPRRTQSEEWVCEDDGGIYVKRLDLIFDFINHS